MRACPKIFSGYVQIPSYPEIIGDGNTIQSEFIRLEAVGVTDPCAFLFELESGDVNRSLNSMAPVAGHVGVEATAELYQLPEFDIWPMSRLLAKKYVGQHNPLNARAVDKFFSNMKTEPRLLFKLTPTNWRAIDMRQYRGKKWDREFQQGQKR